MAARKPRLFHRRIATWLENQLCMTTITDAPISFNYRKVRPFSKAEFKFKYALGQYASERLLPKLRARSACIACPNHYSGVNARVSDVVYLEAIITNEADWGGFGFEFARLAPAQSSLYNLSIRRSEDWRRAEWDSVASASEYFITKVFSPRATDWVQVAKGLAYEQCVDVLAEEIPCI
jgi:hypothetical protein